MTWLRCWGCKGTGWIGMTPCFMHESGNPDCEMGPVLMATVIRKLKGPVPEKLVEKMRRM